MVEFSWIQIPKCSIQLAYGAVKEVTVENLAGTITIFSVVNSATWPVGTVLGLIVKKRRTCCVQRWQIGGEQNPVDRQPSSG